jgi:hypothetical protein
LNICKNLIKNRYENLNVNVKEDNLIGKSEAKESNSRVFSENSKEKTKGDSESKVNEHRNNYDIRDETIMQHQIKPLETKKYPPNSYLICYRCGSRYLKKTGSRFFCNNCLPYTKNEADREADRRKYFWHYTKQFYEKIHRNPIVCQYCGKAINVLEEIVIRGRGRIYFHASCWEKLIGIEDSEPKETISVILVNSDGTREEVSEVIS